MSNKNAVENQSSISLCQPSCGYYFSSGLVISETVYSSASHGAIYNAASRIIIDGGRKALHTAALGGMMMQNMAVPGYAYTSIIIESRTISPRETYNDWLVSGYHYSGAAPAIVMLSGTANEFVLDYNGVLHVFSGGSANSTTINSGGYLDIFYGGIANSTSINNGGSLYVSSGGRATNVVQNSGGVHAAVIGGDTKTYISGTNESGTFSLKSGVASGFVLNNSGRLDVSSGGVANSTTVNSRGSMYVYPVGVANSTTVNGWGYLYVYDNGVASTTMVNNLGLMYVSSGGVANSTTVNSLGNLYVSSDGVADNTTVNSYGRLYVSNGGSATNVVQNCGGVGGAVIGGDTRTYISGTNESGTFLLENGVASGFVLNFYGRLDISSGGVANSTTTNWSGVLNVSNGGIANNTTVNSGGYLSVSSGGSANRTSVSGIMILSGGTANSAIVYEGGSQIVFVGGTALSTTVSSGGNLYVPGGTVSKAIIQENAVEYVSGGQDLNGIIAGTQNVYASYYALGRVSSAKITGYQHIYSGGMDIDAIISGGRQHIYLGGEVLNATVMVSGSQIVYNSGLASGTTISNGGVQIISSGGVASNTDIGLLGSQIIGYGGTAKYTVLSNNSSIQKVLGSSLSATINAGKQYVSSGGIASATTISSGGSQVVSSGGLSYDTKVYNYGSQVVSANGTAHRTSLWLGSQIVAKGGTALDASLGSAIQTILGGTATRTTVDTAGMQVVSSGGVANSTVVNSFGQQVISNSGRASSTTINNFGSQLISFGGTASGTVINANGQQIISSGGLSVSATINSGGSQHIKYSGVASDTTINVGGWQFVSDGGSAVNNRVGSGGSMVVHSGGVVSNTVVESGGSQIISSGGNTSNMIISGGVQYVSAGATDISATILSGGQQHILSDGIANNATVNNSGSQIVFNGGNANSTTVNVGGNQIVHDGASASRAVINTGGLQTVYAGGTVNATDIKGGTQNLSGGRANIVSVINGTQNIYEYGEAYQITLNGGTQNIYDGGMAEDVIINSDAAQNVHSGGSSYSATIKQGGTLNIASGGYASDVIQNSGGNINADVYGGDTATYISGTNQNGGEMRMFGGTASGFVLNIGGRQSVNNGGTASGTIVYAGAEQWVNSGNAAGTVLSGGTMWLAAAGAASSLTLNNGGTAYITGTHTMSGDNAINSGGKITLTRINKKTPAVLTMQNLIGTGGTVSMNVSLSKPEESDKIIITGAHSAGNTVLSLKNIGSSNQIEDDSLKLVEYSGGAAADGTFSLKGGKLDTGWYEYTLGRGDSDGNGNDYYLRSKGEMTPIAKTALAAPAMGNVAINVALNSLQKRLGDLRNMGNGNAQHGIWARGYYQSLTLKDKVETEMKVSGIEAGYDFRLSGTGSSNGEGTYLGIMAGKASISGINGKSKAGKQESKGEGEGILGGAYLTYISDSGFFVDLTARAGSNEMDYSAYSATEDKWLDFSPKRTFVAASGEAGISFDMRHDGTGWKVEPKAEIQYMNVGAKDVEVKNIEDRTIKFGGASYITGIGTLNLAYSWKDGNGLITEPYAEISYIQAISGEEEVSYAGNTEKVKTEGGTIEGRIGLNMQLTSNLYWHAAATIESGSKRESFGADAGIRYVFGGKGRKTEVPVSDSVKPETVVKEIADEEKVSDSVVVADGTVANTVDETINADNEVRTVVAIRPSDEKFSELNAEEYEKKALEAEKLYEESGTMAIPSAGLLFQIGKSEVLPYYQPMLDSFIKLYKQTDGNAKILIEAYSSNGGNETAKNPELSKQRAKSVYKYLVGNGISKENITVRAYSNKKIGEGVFSEDPNCKAGQCYRRVDVSIK